MKRAASEYSARHVPSAEFRVDFAHGAPTLCAHGSGLNRYARQDFDQTAMLPQPLWKLYRERRWEELQHGCSSLNRSQKIGPLRSSITAPDDPLVVCVFSRHACGLSLSRLNLLTFCKCLLKACPVRHCR